MDVDLSSSARELMTAERAAITDLRQLLNALGADPEDVQDLNLALDDLDGLFMLVVSGEYNAGKSSLINALLGEKVMLEGVTPTTDRVTIVTYGDKAKVLEEASGLARREYPADMLRDLAFVDTPGTNAIIQKHQELTEDFIPRADLVLFVTSADRPFTESERRFLDLIASWGKKIVIIVNKLDIIDEDSEQRKVLDFVREHARETLGVTPQVFGLMAKRAFRARESGEEAGLAGTGLPELERYIASSLSQGERLKLKLLNPLGVAERIAAHYQQVVRERLALLEEDKATLGEIDRQLEQYHKDMRREFESYLARVKTVLLEVERRGEVFFDDTVRFRNVFALMNSERIREMFETRVIRNADKDIDLAVSEMVDWFIGRNLNLWEDVMRFVNERRKAGQDRMIGEVGGRFQYDRDALIRKLRQSAEEVMATYDEGAEGERLADRLQGAVVQTGLLQIGGIGLGAAIVALISSTALDITGVTLGLFVAGLGLLVIPRRRQQAKRDLHDKMQELRDGLSESLGDQFETEMTRASEKLKVAIEPYTRFVKSELERLETHMQELEENKARLEHLRQNIEQLG